MIVNMKKMHLIVQKKDTASALEQLRDLESVHVEHQGVLDGYQLTERRKEVEVLEEVMAVLKNLNLDVKQILSSDWRETCVEVQASLGKMGHLKEEMAKRDVLIKEWTAWGSFNLQDILDLKEVGVSLRLCVKSKKDKSDVSSEFIFETIFETKTECYMVAISKGDEDLPYTEIAFPEKSLDDLLREQASGKSEIEKHENFLKQETQYIHFLEGVLNERKDVLGFEEVEQGMLGEGDLAVLKGFLPEDKVVVLEKTAKEHHWACVVEEVSDQDIPPTYLKNPKWVDSLKPVLDLVGILPGCKEIDISPVFLLFFVFFVGMLVGDAAYGLIFLAGVFFAKHKMADKVPSFYFKLGFLLTGFIIIWGVLTGTYFGQAWLPDSVKPLLPWLNNVDNIQLFCFIIALIHLSIARVWAVIVKFPHITFLAEIGWLCIVWGMFFLAKMFVLGADYPSFANYLFMGGIPLAFFFMTEPKKLLGTIGQEFVPFILGVIGAGTDLVSYIRLFAVGLATIAVADAANELASGVPFVVGIVVLLVFHILNMILALMAILVHAIRLNVLEFAGQLGLEWSGFKYNPFKKLRKS